MKDSWLGTTTQIAAIFAFRMLGLFMLIPVFTLYAQHLEGATPALLGIALGGYGLTQGLLQIPFGMLSDRYGRKPLITLGLLLFAIGSLLGAQTHTMYGMIVARILQGSGAIGSVLIALLADLTPEKHRTKAMAVIGAIIGLSFSVAFVLSPSIAAWAGLSGIFYVTAGLAGIGLVLLSTLPSPSPASVKPISNLSQIKHALLDPNLLRWDAGIFFQHFILVASFYALPMILQEHVATGHLVQTWHFYLLILSGSFLAMIPLMLYSEQKKKVTGSFRIAVVFTGLSQCALLGVTHSLVSLGLVLLLYFTAFNFLEANLPSLISKQVNPNAKGSALGVYSSSQFLGIFVGGIMAGFLYPYIGTTGIFGMNAIIAMLWLAVSWKMKID
jgi:MFS family permease